MRLALTYNSRDTSANPPKNEARPEDFLAEWDSPATIEAIRAALARRFDVTPVEADADAFEKLRALRPDLVFNVAEGLHGCGREGLIPSMLDLLGIPYTGSNATTLNLCLHKARAKEVLAYHGIPVAGHLIAQETPRSEPPFGFPAVVKPLHEGSSKGVRNTSLVRTLEELRAEVERIVGGYGEPAIVEPFLPGREFTVAMMGNAPDIRVLPPVEIRFDTLPPEANPLYSYEAKWIWDVPERPLQIFECPARVDEPLARRMAEICRRAYELLEIRDWCRIDVRLDARGEPHILELNPLPGVLPNPEENSCFPKAARAAGMDYPALLQQVVEIACARHGIPLEEEAPVPVR